MTILIDVCLAAIIIPNSCCTKNIIENILIRIFSSCAVFTSNAACEFRFTEYHMKIFRFLMIFQAFAATIPCNYCEQDWQEDFDAIDFFSVLFIF